MDPLLYRKKGINVTCSAFKGLAAVVNCVIHSVFVPSSTLYVHACHSRGALPAPGLAGCPVGHGE
jgi:hypothetical protein